MTASHAPAAAPTVAEARATIASLTWTIEVRLAGEEKRTTHARSLARIRRERAEAERELSRAVGDLSAALQANPTA